MIRERQVVILYLIRSQKNESDDEMHSWKQSSNFKFKQAIKV